MNGTRRAGGDGIGGAGTGGSGERVMDVSSLNKEVDVDEAFEGEDGSGTLRGDEGFEIGRIFLTIPFRLESPFPFPEGEGEDPDTLLSLDAVEFLSAHLARRKKYNNIMLTAIVPASHG